MAEWVYDDFEGLGKAITNNVTVPVATGVNKNVNADYDPYGAGTMVFSTSAANAGTYGIKINTTSNARAMNYYFTAAATVWAVFYVKLANMPTTSIHPLAFWGNTNANLCGDFRITTAGNIAIRDGITSTVTSIDSSTGTTYALSTNTWYRIAIRLTANGTNGSGEMKLYLGDSSSPVWSESDTSISSQNAQASIDSIRFGINQSASVVDFYTDNIHIGSTEWMPTVGAGNVDFDITGNYTANTTTLTSWSVDCRTSAGAVTLTQTSGTTASIVESPTGLFTITNPSGTDSLVFHIEADDNGSVDTANITISRGTAGTTERPAIWVKTASGWS